MRSGDDSDKVIFIRFGSEINNSRRTYLKVINGLRKGLSEFNIIALSIPKVDNFKPGGSADFSLEELLILKTLEALVPSAAASYRQGLLDLMGQERLSYRGTAAELRESLRETLDHLAPDRDVEAQDWYKPEAEQKKPTMRQKARYILISREQNKTQRDSAEKVFSLIEELSGELMRATYNRASLATHVHQSKREVEQIKRYIDTVLFDLLEIVP